MYRFILVVFCFMFSYAKEYMIDISHSSVSFSIKHLSVADTIGVFQDFDGKLFIDNNKIIKLVGNVNISSINTYNEARDKDLKIKDFFSTQVAKFESSHFQNNILYGRLTINNITKNIAFKVNITGPIKNPSLDIQTKQEQINPFKQINIPNNPLQNPQLVKNDDLDCGCYASYGDNVIGIELIGSINRFDFNISPNTPKELLGQNVDIKIILEASN